MTQVRGAKYLWDWLPPLIVLVGLAVGGAWFIQTYSAAQSRQAADSQNQAVLQAYIEKMSDLGLSKDKSDPAKGIVERARTLTALRQLELDEARQGLLLQFLRDSKLLSSSIATIDLSGADLHGIKLTHADLTTVAFRYANLGGADLSGASLGRADLFDADLTGANLSHADLTRANLSRTNLTGANLAGANLFDADQSLAYALDANLSGADLFDTDLRGDNLTRVDLSGADLRFALVTSGQLETAKSLKNAILPDGTKHE